MSSKPEDTFNFLLTITLNVIQLTENTNCNTHGFGKKAHKGEAVDVTTVKCYTND
jgi:hypothetical protein